MNLYSGHMSKELINKNKPLWLRPAEGVTHEEYAELYKFLSADWEDRTQSLFFLLFMLCIPVSMTFILFLS